MMGLSDPHQTRPPGGGWGSARQSYEGSILNHWEGSKEIKYLPWTKTDRRRRLILGDLNARIGNVIIPGLMHKYNEEVLNEQGEKL